MNLSSDNSMHQNTRERVKRRTSSIDTQSKVGLAKRLQGMTKADFLRNRFRRKQILVVPDDIRREHPDKHFAFISMNKLQKQGMYHTNGYRPFNVTDDPTNISKDRFQTNGLDNYLHRNEMILAYIPKEEYEMRQLEDEFFRKDRDLSDLITSRPELEKASPTANHQSTYVSLQDVLLEEDKKQSANGGQHA